MKKAFALSSSTLLILSWMAFELFNYVSTEAVIHTWIGSVLIDLGFLSISWSTLMAVAFCATDLGGLAAIFTPETGKDESIEVKILFVIWMFTSLFNAVLTWLGILNQMQTQPFGGNMALSREMILTVFPFMLAAFLYAVRITLIMTIVKMIDGKTVLSDLVKFKPRAVMGQQPKPQQQPQGKPSWGWGGNNRGKPQPQPQPARTFSGGNGSNRTPPPPEPPESPY